MNEFEAAKLNALAVIVKPTLDSRLRSIYRWYSRAFHVPLPEVEELPIDHILQNWFEDMYEDMPKVRLHTIISQALETEEQRKLRQAFEDAEAASEAEFRRITEAKNKGNQNKNIQQALENQKKLQEQMMKFKQAADEINRTVETLAPVHHEEGEEPPEERPPEVPKDIVKVEDGVHMQFVSDADFEKMLDEGYANDTKK